MKKILLIVPSLGRGGQEMVAVKTAKLLSSSYQVYMYVLASTKNELDIQDIPLFRGVKIVGKKRTILLPIVYIVNYFNIKRLKKKMQIDVAISIASAANLLNIFTKGNEKVITSLRGVKSLYSATSSIKFIQRKTDKLFCVSKGLMYKAQEFYKLNKNHVDYLYNPYNLEIILEKGNEKIEPEYIHSNTVIAVGRIEPVKGFEHLVRAYAKVVQEVPDSQLIIVGEGTMTQALIKLCQALHIENKVHFTGYRENPYCYLKNSKVFVLTSENEGFPNALVEAMAFTAVISVDCETGPREILCKELQQEDITDVTYADYGILVKQINKTRDYMKTKLEKSEKILAEAIIDVLKNKKLEEYYKEAAQKRVQDFSEKEYLQKLISMIEEGG